MLWLEEKKFMEDFRQAIGKNMKNTINKKLYRITEHTNRKWTQVDLFCLWVWKTMCTQHFPHSQTSWMSSSIVYTIKTNSNDVENSKPMKYLFHSKSGFRKLPHTILKMAADARRGRVDYVNQLYVLYRI